MNVAIQPDDNLIATVADAVGGVLHAADGVVAAAPAPDALVPGVCIRHVAAGYAVRLDVVVAVPGDAVGAAIRLRQAAARVCRSLPGACASIDVVIHDVAFAAPGLVND